MRYKILILRNGYKVQVRRLKWNNIRPLETTYPWRLSEIINPLAVIDQLQTQNYQNFDLQSKHTNTTRNM